ncbi:MAG: GldG family protein [Myxococcota bacterium]|nr:GldG family protein [Myxococcota bacterium]
MRRRLMEMGVKVVAPDRSGVARRLQPFNAAQLLQLAGIIAAIVIAGIVNVLSARHFTRWDWTKDKRWSLNPATIQTLYTLEQQVDFWVITGPGDPLEASLRQLLASYQAKSSKVIIHWVDPDRDAIQLVDLQHRFRLEAGRTENGRIATDAIVIVAYGDKHWFLTPQDMFEVTSDDVHVKPREERALTQAIRSVLGGDKARLCFTAGHGELSLEPGKDEREWLGGLRDLLEKGNYELVTVDVTSPGTREPFAGCTVVVIAGAHAQFAPAETNRLRVWLMNGGCLLAAVGPIESGGETGMTHSGLDESLAPFGIALDDDLVHDLDPEVAIPDTHGEGFLVTARSHPVTASLAPSSTDPHPPRVAVFFARSLRHVSPPGASPAADLLVTSDGAFAKRSIVGASEWTDAPPRDPADPRGPFVLAMASERPALTAGAAHGPRAVVIGSRFALAEENWRQPRPLHGAAFLVDSALSWLAARPEVVDVPEKAEVAAGIRVSEQGRNEVRRYVLMLMPLAALLLGAAVWGWRRSSEDKPYEPPQRGSSP